MSAEPLSVNMRILENVEDINVFNQNYEQIKEKYITSPFLNKYEKTRILSERSQQLADGHKPLIPNAKDFTNIYDIAFEELRLKKIPFIIQRPINNSYEYWKLEDLEIL
jgi:DNA-directed RNA polymerase subunit K/omega